MSKIDRFKLRTIPASSGVTIAALAVLLLFVVASDSSARSAQSCTGFVVTGSSSANWTDTATLWNPPGSYPGRDTNCDTASDTTSTAKTITINTAIPNPITALTLACTVPGCIIDIQAGGSLTLAGTGTIGSGSKLRVSGGTLTIASGTTTFQSGSQFEFTGGSVNIQSGATVDFPTGSSGASTGGILSGAGTLSVSGGSLSIGGVTSPGVFSLSAGTLTGPGFLSVTNSMTWSGGTMTGSGGAELAGTGIGTINGANGASAAMVLDGRAFNNYGTIHYTAPAAYPLLLTNGANFTTYGFFNFENNGSITGTAPSSFNVSPNGVVGKNGGLLTSTINPPLTNSGANAFVSSGTLEFAGNTTSTGGTFFAASGGTLKFSAATSVFDGSSFTTADASSTILFSAGNATISGDYQVDGVTSIAGANVDFETPGFPTSVTTSGLLFSAGQLTVNNDVTMTGNGTWSGGTMNGGFTFDVAPGATLTIDAASSSPTIDGSSNLLFANDGTVNYTADPLSGRYLKFMNGAFLDNTGLFDIQTDAQIFAGTGVIIGFAKEHRLSASDRTLPGGSGRRHPVASATHLRPRPLSCGCPNDFNNSGTLQKSADTGAPGMDFGPQLDNSKAVNALSGKLNFLDTYTQTAGSTTLGPGNIQVASPLALNGGTLDGAGLITGSVASNGGEVAPGTASTTGVINLTGTYSETSASKLTIKLAGPNAGQFDQLNVTGTATLAGTFTGTFLGAYTPSTGTTTWSVLTYSTHSGSFATVNLPAYSGGSVTSAYNPTSFDLTAFTPPITDVSITKTGPPSIAVGQNITYTITVTNAGPASAANTLADDVTPPGLIFVSNSGACSGPFPCALGTLTSGQSKVITSVFNVPANYAGTSISNTATVSTSTSDTNTANNSSTATTLISANPGADLSVTKTGPASAGQGDIVDFTITVRNNGPATATNVVVNDPTPAGLTFIASFGACAQADPCLLGTLIPGQVVITSNRYRVSATGGSVTNIAKVSSSVTDPVPANNTASASMSVTPAVCPQAPILSAPASGATVASPVTLSWQTTPGATSYNVTVNGSSSSQTFSTTSTSLTVTLSNGSYSWNVQAIGSGVCTPATSGFSTFTVCNPPGTPIPSVVSVTTTGQTYTVQWTAIEGATSYELQESTESGFSAPASTILPGTSQTFTKSAQIIPTAFYYRVRVVGSCSQAIGSFSATAPVIIVPLPALGSLNPNLPLPSGSTQPVTFPIHVNGLPGQSTSFVASVDKAWLAVIPSSGIMPPEGINFTISADPSSLTDGTWTGTVIIVFGSGVIGGKQALDTAPRTSIPVSISLTTPVTGGTFASPAATAVVIPSVGHLAGLGSQWQSDVRIANITAFSKKVQLVFSGGSATSSAVKATTLSIDPGATTALDDVVRNWYGVGPMGDSSNGVLTVQPLDATGKPDLSVSKSTAVSSRTYNATAVGTLGQFIPAVPLANFIGKAPGVTSILSLQQIAQSDTFRTNLGLLEAIGKPVNLLVSVFNGGGSKVLDLPVALAAGEQRQLNSFLADKGITLTNGHIEVQATSGDGKVTAYASVIDSRNTDPLLVSGVPIGGIGATRYVIPGVANLNTGASWRSDVRVFNSSLTPQTVTLTLYPTGNPSAGVSQSVTIQPGEVKALDDIVQGTFNQTNVGGALHVTTAVAVPLVVTARTYDDTSAGTLGQFVQAVTPADAVGNGDRSLQLLQMEDSPRYRTNLGLAEVTGKPATAEVTVILPDSKVAPKVQIPLAAFEFRQFAIISSLGLGNTYNARISVKVIDGQGKVTAYGSVIDQKTQDPTFVPAQ
jgi:uncharacterized repeat protein (TIGR01451 family)